MSIKIILCEDHALFRCGLIQLLSMNEEISVIAEISNGQGILDLINTENSQLNEANLLLLDISLPDIDGIKLIPQVKKAYPHIKILIISMYDMPEYVRSAFNAGADGYLLKTADSEEFFFAIQSLLRGTNYVSSELTNIFIDAYLQNDGQPNTEEDILETITLREKEILIYVAKGLSNKEIAVELNIAEKTVSTHRTNFMRKLSLHNVREITMFAVQKNLIDIN